MARRAQEQAHKRNVSEAELDALDQHHIATIERLRADVARLTQERDELQRRLDRVVTYADGVVTMFDLPDTRYRWREQREAMDRLRAALAPEQEAG